MTPSSAVLGGAILLATSAYELAWADVGVQVGARGGVELGADDVDGYVGADLRLSSPHSPLTIAVTFDYFLAEQQTLYQLGGTALYHLPRLGRIAPYLGIGANLTTFSFDEAGLPPGVDGHGSRLGMHLLAGARLDLGWVSPFAQIAQGIGEFDLLTVGGGLAFTLREQRGPASPPALGRLLITPYIDNNIAGDVQSGRVGLGVSLAYYLRGKLGFELDAELHGHFFRDEDVADLVPEGVDLNTNAVLVSGNVVVPYGIRSALFGHWWPYATVGAGLVHAMFDGFARAPGTQMFATTQTNLALNGGAGLVHAFSRHVGFRVDARYIRALVDEDARTGGYFKDYGFLRLSVGVWLGFGASSSRD